MSRIPITVDGITYSSGNECARAHNVKPQLFHDRIKIGWTAEEAVHPERRKKRYAKSIPITVDGIAYETVKAAAKANSLKPDRVCARLSRNIPTETALQPDPLERHGKKIIVDGTEYPSIKACARAHNIPDTTLRHKLKKGMPIQEAIETSGKTTKKPVTVNDVTYASMHEAIEALHTTYNKLHRLLNPKPKSSITYRGKQYPSLSAIARVHGLKPTLLIARMRTHGMTLEEAVEFNRPFLCKPQPAFTNHDGVTYHYAKCPTCQRILLLPEQELDTFQHDEEMCKQRSLPNTANITNPTVRQWLQRQRRKSS